jgi:hypothetical protein
MIQSIFLKAKYLKNECDETEDLFLKRYISFFKEVQAITGEDLSKVDNKETSLSKDIKNSDMSDDPQGAEQAPEAKQTDNENDFLSKRLKPIYIEILYKTHPDKHPKDITEKEKKRLTLIYTDCIKAINTSDFFSFVDCADRLFIDFPKFEKDEILLLNNSCKEFENKINKYKNTYPWVWGLEDDSKKQQKILQDYLSSKKGK